MDIIEDDDPRFEVLADVLQGALSKICDETGLNGFSASLTMIDLLAESMRDYCPFGLAEYLSARAETCLASNECEATQAQARAEAAHELVRREVVASMGAAS